MPAMGAEYEVDELGALRKRPTIKNTYGKGPRRRQPKATFAPVTESESMSEEDPIIASNSTVARRQPVPSASSPKLKTPSARFKGLSGPRDTRPTPASFQEIASSNRKRKVSQIYKTRERSQPVTNESEEESAPSAPEPRRSRIALSEPISAAKPSRRERAYTQLSSSDSTIVEVPRSRPSSPPPTPPSASISSAKPASSHVSGRKSANALSTANAPKQTTQRQHRIALHLAGDSTTKIKQPAASPATAIKKQALLVPANESPGPKLPKTTRKRLIDVLVEQEEHGDAVALDEDVSNVPVASSEAVFGPTSSAAELDDQSLLETPKPKARTAPATGVRTFTRSTSALKFTYGQGRKVLEEEDNLLESLALPQEASYSRRLDLESYKKPTSATGAFDFENDDGTTNGSPSSKLRDIYELRQAGANSRVADAMQDLIDQIGKPGISPSSSRRAALLQVAEKLRDKVFIQQCRDHGVESALLKDIAKETDAICGYLILSSLVTIITKSPSAHMCQLLCKEQPGPVFSRLLSIREDIKKIAKDRKSNLSKRNQNLIVGIESQLQKLPIWDGNQPPSITPRSLVTKCLQLLIAQDILIGSDPGVFTEAVTEHLFKVLSDASNDTEYFNYPQTAQSTELCSALSVLNVHAVSVATIQGSDTESTIRYLPVIADVLYISLQKPAHKDKTLGDLILKLTINLTNNNLAASRVFAAKGLLPALAASVSNSFNQALAHISQDTWTEGILNSLYLQLGILINFAEHSDLSLQMLNDCQHENRDLVKELIRLFIENHCRTSEADSMEKTHLNVAFGYLSVLLGYLALHKPVRQELARSQSTRNIGSLIGSIREFIAHYEQVENAISESDGGDRHHGGYAERLRELAQQLEDKAAHD
ncbi:wings apart-like protein regulation of heterochromatin-domain-containing protein [Xylaria intraflava]|nr:wings apart-like protein regulation of heterochromatin-domain-containing protein [Xylaria intraflava]